MTKTTHRLRPLTALVLAALFLFTASVPALAAPAKGAAWEEMEYEHYDPSDFKEKVKALTDAAEKNDPDTVISLYDQLYDEYMIVFTYYCLSQVHNSQDVTDEYWADEMVYCSGLVTELSDLLSSACHQALESPGAVLFAAHLGENATRELLEYEPLTARELALTKKETSLINEYTAFIDKSNEAVYSYKGREWTLDLLDGEEGAGLTDDEYNDILYGIYDVLSQGAADIFLQLVDIRTEIAKINGYDDYNQYAYEKIYYRDYTVEQAQSLLEEVREISQQVPDSPVLYMTDAVAPVYSTQQDMLAVLHQYAGQVDPAFDQAYAFMKENHLCDIAVGPGRAAGSFTIQLPAYDSAFIYSNDTGSVVALSTLFHEFGHFTALGLASPENYLTSWRALDLAEIPSTGMELLVLPFYDDIYRQGADIARYVVLFDTLTAVTDQAMFAQFENQIYADPDSYATAEALNKLYNDVGVEYGFSDIGSDPTWIFTNHFFESPGYVISYVTATLASIQIWDAAQQDRQSGVDLYMDIVRQGPYDTGYFDVIKSAGLKSFDTPGTATEVCDRLLDTMRSLEAGILGGEDRQPPADGQPDQEAPDETAAPDPTAAPETEAPAVTEAPAETEAPDGPEDVLDVETRGMTGATEDSEAEEETTDVLG